MKVFYIQPVIGSPLLDRWYSLGNTEAPVVIGTGDNVDIDLVDLLGSSYRDYNFRLSVQNSGALNAWTLRNIGSSSEAEIVTDNVSRRLPPNDICEITIGGKINIGPLSLVLLSYDDGSQQDDALPPNYQVLDTIVQESTKPLQPDDALNTLELPPPINSVTNVNPKSQVLKSSPIEIALFRKSGNAYIGEDACVIITFPMSEGDSKTFGRQKLGNDLTFLNDNTISRRQGQFIYEAGKLYVENLPGVIHKIMLNGNIIESKRELRTGDVLQVGDTEFDVLLKNTEN